ncbi:uncharacterized protein N7443_000093 [Penicillium atrosanguineum]|uniref:uncharacterized protein n=1 Tax=Penicillium atrosanguineum TaxID=1132637 RepID=UPI002397C345|nr:uncharacterized protein N7443_000093 [Penicillium atrosanguineum]KAJ5148336.1 hypothetical protein N7526_001688 [Penicillium atrosanguineum]KAJ5313209.1 hypothetical protein N7443_000093 [Penicillium atrosanguineum]
MEEDLRAQVGAKDQPVDAVNDVQVQIDLTERRTPINTQQVSAVITAEKLQEAPKQRRGRSRRVENESEDELSAELNARKDQC